ncbi:MAG: sugar kinase [Nitrospirae bacterium]|jgi:ADP-dependent NAD(P)H-hydrate dehydratase / NAD(P)H-hydrate epimerase|nr:sugar kinase [Nitrospirota bacterium]
MLAVVGTIPDKEFPLTSGPVLLNDDHINIRDKAVNINRGTPALLAAAVETLKFMKKPNPVGYLIGDIGLGDGSRRLYKFLTENLKSASFHTITFHYLQPDVDWCNKVILTIEDMSQRPILIADAGFMYVAKMSGNATIFDLFTPDAGELAFLADEEAPHPFYTRGFILHEENLIPDLIKRAYIHGNAARYLLVKGKQDYIVDKDGIITVIDSPDEEALEPIGGTGDTLTGIVSALIASGMEISLAAALAAKVNRLAGYHAMPTPATQVSEIIKQIPRALEDVFNSRKTLI